MLFHFLCPKQKSESLFIALLVLCKRGNCSCRSLQKKNEKSDLLFKYSESLFRSQKTSDSHKKPKSEFPEVVSYCVTRLILLSPCTVLIRLGRFWSLGPKTSHQKKLDFGTYESSSQIHISHLKTLKIQIKGFFIIQKTFFLSITNNEENRHWSGQYTIVHYAQHFLYKKAPSNKMYSFSKNVSIPYIAQFKYLASI